MSATNYDTAIANLLREIEAAKANLIRHALAAQEALIEELPTDESAPAALHHFRLEADQAIGDFQERVASLADGLEVAGFSGGAAFQIAREVEAGTFRAEQYPLAADKP